LTGISRTITPLSDDRLFFPMPAEPGHQDTDNNQYQRKKDHPTIRNKHTMKFGISRITGWLKNRKQAFHAPKNQHDLPYTAVNQLSLKAAG
jgi:hypothetical protein